MFAHKTAPVLVSPATKGEKLVVYNGAGMEETRETAEEGQVKLTKAGRAKAVAVYERHTLITDFFAQQLGVNPVTAEKDACKIEHVISEETFLRLRAFMVERGYEPRK